MLAANGTLFDSSRVSRPFRFVLGQTVIKGWDQAVSRLPLAHARTCLFQLLWGTARPAPHPPAISCSTWSCCPLTAPHRGRGGRPAWLWRRQAAQAAQAGISSSEKPEQQRQRQQRQQHQQQELSPPLREAGSDTWTHQAAAGKLLNGGIGTASWMRPGGDVAGRLATPAPVPQRRRRPGRAGAASSALQHHPRRRGLELVLAQPRQSTTLGDDDDGGGAAAATGDTTFGTTGAPIDRV